MSINFILLVGAAVCFSLAVFGVNARNVNLIALGLLLLVLSQIV